jgi:hypothetical protein
MFLVGDAVVGRNNPLTMVLFRIFLPALLVQLHFLKSSNPQCFHLPFSRGEIFQRTIRVLAVVYA